MLSLGRASTARSVAASAKPRVKVPEIIDRETELKPRQLTQYFERIELPTHLQNERRLGRLDSELLRAIVKGHITHIPFENLSLVHPKAKEQDGNKVSLDLQSVFDKLVTRKRGGYCFEQNTLIAAVLTTMGFRCYTTAARSVPDGKPQASRQIGLNGLDHQVVLVSLEKRDYVVDVGFGAQSPKEPILMTESSLERFKNKGKGDHRLRRGHLGVKKGPQDRREAQKEGWYMQRLPKGDQNWTDIYFFFEHEFLPKDFEVANYFWSENPELLYRQRAIACLHTEEGRITLNGQRLRIFRDALVDEKQLGSQEEVDAALKEHFNISF
jgi:N-hydroxyarylamine O-acetyltransferase